MHQIGQQDVPVHTPRSALPCGTGSIGHTSSMRAESWRHDIRILSCIKRRQRFARARSLDSSHSGCGFVGATSDQPSGAGSESHYQGGRRALSRVPKRAKHGGAFKRQVGLLVARASIDPLVMGGGVGRRERRQKVVARFRATMVPPCHFAGHSKLIACSARRCSSSSLFTVQTEPLGWQPTCQVMRPLSVA